MRTLLIPLLIPLILASCAYSSGTVKTNTGFKFNYEGNIIIIGSKNDPKGGGDPYNILVSESLGLKAIDYSQDGIIDDIVEGSFIPERVQRMYDYGLDEAIRRGKLRRTEWEQTWEFSEGTRTYIIKSFQPYSDPPYIEFYIDGPLYGNVKALDKMSDGMLDYILQGHQHSLLKLQNAYEKALQKGLADKELEKIDGIIRIKRTQEPSPTIEIRISSGITWLNTQTQKESFRF